MWSADGLWYARDGLAWDVQTRSILQVEVPADERLLGLAPQRTATLALATVDHDTVLRVRSLDGQLLQEAAIRPTIEYGQLGSKSPWPENHGDQALWLQRQVEWVPGADGLPRVEVASEARPWPEPARRTAVFDP